MIFDGWPGMDRTVPMVSPSRIKTQYKTYAKQWRRLFWLLLEKREANGCPTTQVELAIFVDSLTVPDFYSLLRALKAGKTQPLGKEELQGLLKDMAEAQKQLDRIKELYT